MNKTIVVNLFAPPGTGKSTGAAYIFSKLKMNGINVELVTEFAKDKVYEESKEVFKCQPYILGKQYFKMNRCRDKVDVIITDSPLLLSVFYDNSTSENFSKHAYDLFDSFYNINIMLKRTKKYNTIGRFQTEEESDLMVKPMYDLLDRFNLNYSVHDGSEKGYGEIIDNIMRTIRYVIR